MAPAALVVSGFAVSAFFIHAGLASAFIDGLVHPLTTPAHVVAMTGLALVAGRTAGPGGFAIVPAFLIGLAAGETALARGVGETPAGIVLLAGAALCGVTVAAGVAAPAVLLAIGAPAALLSGAALGLDSPPQAVTIDAAFAALAGTASAGVAALELMRRIAATAACWRDGIALRVAGSWIAAIATMALAVVQSGATAP